MTAIIEFAGDYRFLSNFWPVNISMHGLVYRTAEHAYQACKTLNMQERVYISSLPTPGAAKREGRNLTIRPDWKIVRVSMMRLVVTDKFSDPLLATWLLATGDRDIIEGNRWGDTFWGADLRTGRGENYLGQILMSIRSDLRLQRGG